MRARLLVLLLFLLAACGDPAAVSESASDSASAASGATVSVDSNDLGEILVDGEGRTLYLLTGDKQGAPTCYEDCETNWPPLQGPATAGEGADDAMLGEAEREDGTSQATYNDWPLYYFAGDSKAGDINGQGVGDVWYVLDAAGKPIKEAGGADIPRDY